MGAAEAGGEDEGEVGEGKRGRSGGGGAVPSWFDALGHDGAPATDWKMASGCDGAVNEEPFKLSPVMTETEAKEKLEASKEASSRHPSEEGDKASAKEVEASAKPSLHEEKEAKNAGEDKPTTQSDGNGEVQKTDEGRTEGCSPSL
eukprot:755192-Hanusia_phi.AAC.2